MKRTINLLIAIVAVYLTISCSEDHDCEEGAIETPNAVATIDGTSYQATLAECRTPKIQNFTISGINGGQIRGASGTVIIINPQSLIDNTGAFIDGPATVELLEFYTNGEVIACQLSTNTLNNAGSIEPTLAKGLVHIDITFDGEPIFILGNIQVFIPEENNSESLLQFTSPICPDVNCRVLWEQNFNTEVLPTEIDNPDGTLSNGYITFVQNLGWISIAQYNPVLNRTFVYNKAPAGYDTSNSDVFLVYDSPEIGISLFTSYNESLGVFDENFGEIPLRQEATFVFTSRDTQYQFSTSTQVISQDIIGLTTSLSTISEQGLIDAINSL